MKSLWAAAILVLFTGAKWVTDDAELKGSWRVRKFTISHWRKLCTSQAVIVFHPQRSGAQQEGVWHLSDIRKGRRTAIDSGTYVTRIADNGLLILENFRCYGDNFPSFEGTGRYWSTDRGTLLCFTGRTFNDLELHLRRRVRLELSLIR